MRRSRSSSGIPLPSFKRASSSENLKSSLPQSTLKRSGSYSQLSSQRGRPPPRKEKLSIFGSSSKVSIGSSSKASLCTPLRTGLGISRLPSPGQILTSQKINDKKFSADQYRKICCFLEPLMEDFDPKYVKSLTVKMFVTIITILFQEIDPRIHISMENYKEIVMKYMKLYKYPGQISLSLLKSVNTPHSWAPVMAIFGWLVDLIHQLKGEDFENDKLKKFISTRMKVKYKGGQVKGLLVNLIDEMIGLDRNEYNNLQTDIHKLESEMNAESTKVASLKEQEKILREEINRMENEIKEFNEENNEEKMKNEINLLEEELKDREIDIKKLKASKAKTKEIISNQKYTLKEKQDLEKEIEDKEYSLHSKKQSLENVKKLKDQYDLEQTDFRRQLESEVLKTNESLMKLKLSLVNADGKKIQLPDRGFQNQDFLEVVEEKRQYLGAIKKRTLTELEETKSLLSNAQLTKEEKLEEIKELKQENTRLIAKIQKLQTESERITFESEIMKEQYDKKIGNLMKKSPDLDALEKRKAGLQRELLKLNEELEKLSEHSVDIFKKIYSDTKSSSTEMRAIMSEILQGSYEALESVTTQEEDILNKLQKTLDKDNVECTV